MATQKVERLLNLVICLLSTRQFLTAEYIRRNVAGYNDDGQSDEAFNRMFERDKNELRDLGIPLVTGRDRMSGNAEGYRINRDVYELPDIELDRSEAAVVAMAAALWEAPEVAATAQNAVLKLRAAGLDVRADDELVVPASLSPRSVGSEAALAALLAAIDAARPVTFDYRPGAAASTATRTLEPWGIVTHRGRWYVTGHDRDRSDTRTFRLSRISGVTPIGRAGDVVVPAGTDIQQLVSAAVESAAGGDSGTARIWVARDRAAGLRRLAARTEPESLDGEPGDVIEVEIRSVSTLARMVLGAGPNAVVLGPPELRETVLRSLDELVGVAQR
ncbi:WYL domain-containing protein [Gordonia sp. PKS22-38]|uniref:WYL domain-containing protein n=1 Tax=Gordonia prachuapensis TaxID=3115651 RepID=A0ABU7MZD5_9ACTN|nr:WYL domain-containing protein [Gordonia sp. PKS22-38]